MENAYTRADVTRPKDKFAFLESKFVGCEDTKVNKLLQGTTDDDWTSFLAWPHKGRPDQLAPQRFPPRDGRHPQQLSSHFRDRISKFTLYDILKEVLLKEIPAEVRQHAATTIKELDFQSTADHLKI